MKRSYLLTAIVVLPVLLTASAVWRAIAGNVSPITQPGTARLIISAAASLQDALEAIDPIFESAHPEIQVDYNFASSGSLQKQIEQGAPADIFFSASPKQMDVLQSQRLLIEDTRRNVVGNNLALIIPKTSQATSDNFKQLTAATVQKIAVGEFRSVPAGQYAEATFKHLGLLDQLQPKFVFGNSVRNVLSAVESGNADAGLVYATDTKLSKNVQTVAIAPPESHPEILYPIAIVKTSAEPTASQSYIDFLMGQKAQDVFQEFGFTSAD